MMTFIIQVITIFVIVKCSYAGRKMKQNIAHLHIMVPYSLVLGCAVVCGVYSLPFFSLGSHLLFFLWFCIYI
jgi:hypothetical protein